MKTILKKKKCRMDITPQEPLWTDDGSSPGLKKRKKAVTTFACNLAESDKPIFPTLFTSSHVTNDY